MRETGNKEYKNAHSRAAIYKDSRCIQIVPHDCCWLIGHSFAESIPVQETAVYRRNLACSSSLHVNRTFDASHSSGLHRRVLTMAWVNHSNGFFRCQYDSILASLLPRQLAPFLFPSPGLSTPRRVFIDPITRLSVGAGRRFSQKRISERLEIFRTRTYFRNRYLVRRYGNNSLQFASSRTMRSTERFSNCTLCIRKSLSVK